MLKPIKNVFKKFIPKTSIHPYYIAGNIIRKKTSQNICSGPFAGLHYVQSSIGSAYYPKILGTYELELHPIIEELCKKSFHTIINIGAGEGYYAVGMALRNPATHIIAFEATNEGQNLIKQMAAMNGATNVAVYGHCDTDVFSKSIPRKETCAVIIDVEGAEAVLLNKKNIPNLSACYILVEVHDFVSRNIGDNLLAEFQDSHKIIELWSQERTLAHFPINLAIKPFFIPKKYFIASMDEGRPQRMRWFYLTPKF